MLKVGSLGQLAQTAPILNLFWILEDQCCPVALLEATWAAQMGPPNPPPHYSGLKPISCLATWDPTRPVRS